MNLFATIEVIEFSERIHENGAILSDNDYISCKIIQRPIFHVLCLNITISGKTFHLYDLL